MNRQLFTLSLIEIVLSILVTVVIIFITYKFLQRLFFRKDNMTEHHLAFSIFTSGIVLSVGIILSEILPSITNIIRLSTTHSEETDLSTILQYSGLYLLIGFAAAIIINVSVFFLYSILTKGVNEFNAIKENNVPVAILVVSILISITLIVKDSIALLISSLVPYPEVTNFL